MNIEQKEFLENVIGAFKDDPEACNEWEQGFMNDMAERFDKYGERTYVSAKQWSIITRVADHYGVT